MSNPLPDVNIAFDGSVASALSCPTDVINQRQTLAQLLQLSDPALENIEAVAQNLIHAFGSLRGVLQATNSSLQEQNLHSNTITMLHTVLAAHLYAAKDAIVRSDVTLRGSQEINDYLIGKMALEDLEKFKVLFFDSDGLIADEDIAVGSVSNVKVSIRDIAKRCFDLNASSVVLAHNHPSGNPRPSDADRHMTREIEAMLSLIEVSLYDHVIVGRGGQTFSFSDMGLLHDM